MDYSDFLDTDAIEGGASKVPPASPHESVEGEVLPPIAKTAGEREHAIIERCVTDRIFFCEVVLGIVLEDWQTDVLIALDKGETRIAIRSGNGAGKTMLISVVILHYLLFRNDVKIPVTAPASSQLKDGLIPETNKWIRRLPDFLRKTVHATQDRVVRTDNPENNFISFRTARKETPEALAGIHATFVMCAVDEASAVVEAVYEAAKGTLSTPGAIFLMISNPTRLSGLFYDAFHRLKHKWRRFHVTSFDTSRVDVEFVQDIEETYGKSSTQYEVKVMGNFPTSEEEALISRADFTSAVVRDIRTNEAPVWGVDVGRGGDLSALVERNGRKMTKMVTKNYSDTMQTVGWVKEQYDEAKDKPESIFVDVIGIGAGVADRLRELGLPVVDVNVSESSSMSGKYPRLRDELWWNLKNWFESKNVAIDLMQQIPDDVERRRFLEKVEEEVCTPLALFTSGGKDSVESKAQLKARGYMSPNIADAACLTFAYQGSVGSGAYGASTGGQNWNKEIDFDPVGLY